MPDAVPHPAEDAELRAHVEQALTAAYELDREIGRGGMGIVYRARDRRLKRYVAIKLLPPELAFRRDVRSRFLREAETAAQLSHPNIVPIYSVDEVGNLVFFVMACIDGENLAHQLATRGPLPVDEVQRWLLEVADALAYAHARGVVHRDIKPDNILVDAIDGRALVTDFGIARAASDDGEAGRLTATGMAIGTPAYMSPEQASGDRDLDARSDLYSLGIVAYQMLCGEPPFTGNNAPALLLKHLAEPPEPIARRRPDVPPQLAALVMRLLEKNPDHRVQRAADLADALRAGRATGRSPSRVDAPAGYVPPPYTATTAAVLSAAGPSPTPARPVVQADRPAADFRSDAPTDGLSTPTAEDLARWNAPGVVAFRRKLGPFLFFGVPLAVVSVISRGGFGSITTAWGLYLAWKYVKLWSDGFDWRDVLRQPRERLFGEVLSDLVDSVSATFSRSRREQLKAQGRLRGNSLDAVLRPGTPLPGTVQAARGRTVQPARPVRSEELGPHLALVRGARDDREEIARLLETLPAADRGRLPDLAGTAIDLVNRIEADARDLARFERDQARDHEPDALGRIDAEVAALEAEANPHDTGSEARVRRLAQLRRDRRTVVEARGQLEARRRRLESSRLALENIRLDLIRLRTGGSTVQSVTRLAEQAMAMAREVDIAVQAAREVRGVIGSRSGPA